MATKLTGFNYRLLAKLSPTKCTSRFELSVPLERGFAQQVNTHHLLLAVFASSIGELTGETRIYLTVEGHGRDSRDVAFSSSTSVLDVSNTVGWFTIMFPMEIQLDSGVELSGVIATVRRLLDDKKSTRSGLEYGPLLGYTGATLPRISFNYLGDFDKGGYNSGNDHDWKLVPIATVSMETVGSAESGDNGDDIIALTAFRYADRLQLSVGHRLESATAHLLEETLEGKLGELASLSQRRSLDQPDRGLGGFVPYVEFNSGAASGGTWFLLPPGEGGAESYVNLVRWLASRRLVIFNNYYRWKGCALKSFEDLSRFYIRIIREVQPAGPYNLLGWSFGGVLALEIARQLAGEGERVGHAIFVDSYFNVKLAHLDNNLPLVNNFIFDAIHYKYAKSRDQFALLPGSVGSMTLFKAGLLSDSFVSDDHRTLLEFYHKSTHNNLDSLVEKTAFQTVVMAEATHFSWVQNDREVKRLCEFLLAFSD